MSRIVTGYTVGLEQRHLTKYKDELDVCISLKTSNRECEDRYILQPSQAVDLIALLAGQVSLAMAEKWRRQQIDGGKSQTRNE